MKVLLLSAYHGSSHRAWVKGLTKTLPEHTFIIRTLPPRFFPWRSRGSALSWSQEDLPTDLDLLVTTSIVDLASLKGLRPDLASLPTLVYHHENQFEYPRQQKLNSFKEAGFLITGIYTALSADWLLFNSQYNRRTFLDGAQYFLKQMPDKVPPGILERLESRSEVVPVGLPKHLFDPTPRSSPHGPLRLLWNHRWEHDKAPDRFVRALEILRDRNLDFRLLILGQQFRDIPAAFRRARVTLRDHLDQFGYVESRQQYRHFLAQSDFVISTSLHDFQGIAIQEAILAGALPALPDRLVYPELYDASFLYPSFPNHPEQEARALADHLETYLLDPARCRAHPRPDLTPFRWSHLAARYRQAFQKTLTLHARHRPKELV